jgi:acyl carrier protein
LAALPLDQRYPHLLDIVHRHIAAVLAHPDPAAIDPHAPFKDLGFDSLTAVELRNRLSTAAGTRLPATLIFDHPSSDALATYLINQLLPAAPAEPSLLDEIDRLEDALTGTVPDDTDRVVITTRLQAVLARWNELNRADDETVIEKITSATADEIFDFIDKDLGRI